MSGATIYAVLHNKMVYSSIAVAAGSVTKHIYMLESSGGVTQIAIDGDTIYALGLQGAIYWQPLGLMTPKTAWRKMSPGPARAIDASAGRVYIVGRNYRIYRRRWDALMLPGEPWTLVSNCSVDRISVVGDAIYGRDRRSGGIYLQTLGALGTGAPWHRTHLDRLPSDLRPPLLA